MNCSNTYCNCSNPCCSGGCTCKSTTTTSTTTIPFVCPEENCDETINLDGVVYSGANSDCLNIYKNQRLDDVIRALFTSVTGIDCFPPPPPTTTTSTSTTTIAPTTTTTTTVQEDPFLCFNLALLEAGGGGSLVKPKQGDGIFNNKPYYIIEDTNAVYWDGFKWVFTEEWTTTKEPLQVFTQNTQYPISQVSDWTPSCDSGDSTLLKVSICNVTDSACPTTTSTTIP